MFNIRVVKTVHLLLYSSEIKIEFLAYKDSRY